MNDDKMIFDVLQSVKSIKYVLCTVPSETRIKMFDYVCDNMVTLPYEVIHQFITSYDYKNDELFRTFVEKVIKYIKQTNENIYNSLVGAFS